LDSLGLHGIDVASACKKFQCD